MIVRSAEPGGVIRNPRRRGRRFVAAARAAAYRGLGALALVLLAMASAAADTAGPVYGTFTIQGNSVRLTHAYAIEPRLAPEPRNHAPYVAGTFIVMLTDRPISGAVLRHFGQLHPNLSDSSGFFALTFLFDRASEQALNCSVLAVSNSGVPGSWSIRNQTGFVCPLGDGRLITKVYALRGSTLTAAIRTELRSATSLEEPWAQPDFVFNLAFTAPISRVAPPEDGLDDGPARGR